MARTYVTVTFVLLLIISISIQIGYAQSADEQPTSTPAPSPTPTDEERRLADEIRLLKLQKEKAQLEKDIVSAAPTPSITPLEGKVTFNDTDRLSMEIEIQSYRAMRKVTDNISCDIRKTIPNNFSVVLYKAEDYAAWRNYNLISPTLKSQLDGMKEEYKSWLNAKNTVDFRNGVTNRPEKLVEIKETLSNGQSSGSPAISTFSTIATTALAGITGTVKSFAELMSLFRSDVTFTNKEVSLNSEALKASISRSFVETQNARCLNKDSVRMLDPANFSPASDPKGGAFNSPVLTDIKDLIELQRVAAIKIALYEVVETDLKLVPGLEQKVENLKAAQKVKDAEIKALDANHTAAAAAAKPDIAVALAKARAEQQNLMNEFMNATNTLADFNKKISAYSSESTVANRVRISRLKALNSELNTFITTFAGSSNNGPSLLSQYVKAENLNAALNENNVYWLRINAIKGGGNTRTQKNLFRYFYKPNVSHSGGAIIEYSLTDRNGSILVANTDATYLKYRKASKIQE